MNFRHFHYFVVVAEELHVARAAVRLGIAQPALSQQIRALEEQLGVRLFHRANRRITLTEAGEAFLVEARAALMHAEQAGRAARRAARGETGRVDIGYVSSALAELPFLSALAAFRATHPAVRIGMHMRLAADHLAALRTQTFDLVITRGPMPEPPEDYDSLVLSRQPMIVALPDSHPLATRAGIALPELAENNFLVPDDPPGCGTGHAIALLCEAARFTPRSSMVVNEMSSAVGLVAGGLGVALLPASAARFALPGVVFRPLIGGAFDSDLIAFYRRHEHSAAVLALLAALRRHAAV
ncbi:MAG: LysR family transcriptional regulator [Candidatus Dactylopiibacterium carminicum]|uniref:LysR family transcriptional regulator n=1 Tax=Candidatus Dactylopiibacterium carminicum TaxID=857335 RepID=A0A272EMR0_9RHOO|nr:LysR substrate-binding domain-containing protein [Candidatus Dactylopiibacterium carminicum]KAF7597807.1 LysR family transcriptional regulator [Candidatus Dactylopiibacterium carminicum]PAS91407.1 MAG: LysR family transcriptional regulator [Candidatus Dactylopiibacterium carminicum]PAS92532.1 MAG: LysR family transcriptional regulator [Candidatus Dactylopiibacterium carminicum]PAS95600.1 MAG: hypothetical protein BSR46_16765 [Candidatus Dactylopiibacterium carminicum]